MSEPAIRVESISKRYQLGAAECPRGRFRYKSLRESLSRGVRASVGRLVGGKTEDESKTLWALRDISFVVQPGEVVGIIGRNGAGKSTLLKILSRITEPTGGCAEINGHVGSLLEVGAGFHPELTGRENIFLNGAILGMRQEEIRQKLDEIVAFSEIEKFLDTAVKQYSSGMYMRLAFAVAAHLETEILVVDEVLAVGDAEFQKKCLGKMQSVASQEGRTVLFVSHNMAAVRNLCSRGLVLEGGRVSFDGSAAEAIAIYSANGRTPAGASWKRAQDAPSKPMSFSAITANLRGAQPQLRLECRVTLGCASPCPKSLIAVDICDATLSPIMQALPSTQPFIEGSTGTHQLAIEIDLPPLVPGMYSADFWIGSHYSSTFDYVKNVVSFEVTESPAAERTFPHSPAHGFMVPNSRCEYETTVPSLVVR